MGPVLERLANHPNVFHPRLAPELSQAVLLAENLGQMPVLGGNAAEKSWWITRRCSTGWWRTSTAAGIMRQISTSTFLRTIAQRPR